MTTRPTRNSVAYVRYHDGKEPNRIRSWPHAKSESSEGPIVGKAPNDLPCSCSATLHVPVQVGSTTKTFDNPRTDPQGRVWWYVRAYDQDSRTIVQGWTAENEGAEVYLVAL